MDSTLIMKGLFVSIAISTLCLVRPMCCQREVSIPKDTFETSDRRIIRGCYIKCLMLKSRHINKFQVRHSFIHGCFRRCVNRQIVQEAVLGATPSKKFIVLGADDAPPEKIIVPSRMPHLPKELYKDADRRRWQHGDCDAFDMQRKIDGSMKSAVLLDHVGVTCTNENELLVSWEQPTGLANCTGYQVNYRLGGNSESDGIYCFDVNKDRKSLVINKDKGFYGQQEIYLAVVALPLPFKCDIKLQKFQPCRDIKRERIQRRDVMTPSYVILGKNDPVPTDLEMPAELPTFPPDPFDFYRHNSNCRQPRHTSNSRPYAGRATGVKVSCRLRGNYTKKAFVVHWDQPKDYLIADYSHFQVIYSITPRNFIHNPKRLGCRELGKNNLSHVIEYNVENTDTIDVVVVAYPNNGGLTERMETFQPCALKSSPSPPPSTTATKGSVYVVASVGSSIVVIVALAMLVSVFVYRRKHPDYPPEGPIPKEQIYVSYYPDSERYHSSLLNLVVKLRKLYSVNLIMDSYCETEVTELGLARWCQMQLSGSTRILMVISKEYLKICEKWQNGLTDVLGSDVNVNRVCSELQYIVNHIFETRKNSLLTIVLADVTQRDLPAPFRGMKSFKWPKNADDEHAIASNICAEESIVAL